MRMVLACLCVMLSATGLVWAQSESLIHYWSFDEGEGLVASDQVGDADGMLQGFEDNSRPVWVGGKNGRAIYFQRSGGFPNVVNAGDLEHMFTSMTMCCWVWLDGNQAPYTGVLTDRYPNEMISMFITVGDPLVGNQLGFDYNGGHLAWSSGIVLPIRTWVFIALVVNHDTQTATVHSYVDGVMNSADRAGYFPGWQISRFWIGAENYGTRIFNGRIDDVRLYEAALTAAELQAVAEGDFLLVDDLESYTDTTALRLTWTDGDAGGTTGSSIVLATTGAYQGDRALSLVYNNNLSGRAYYSEVSRPVTGDWSGPDTQALSIRMQGAVTNAAEVLYVALADGANQTAVVTHPDPAAVQQEGWVEWNIPLGDFDGVNLADVSRLYIGLGDRDNPLVGGAGTILLDEIKVYPQRCLAPLEGDANGDCRVDMKDFGTLAGSWLESTVFPTP